MSEYYIYAALFLSGIGVGYALFGGKTVSYVQTPTDHMVNSLQVATDAVKASKETGGSMEPDHVKSASESLARGAQKALEVVHTAAEAAKDHLEGKDGN